MKLLLFLSVVLSTSLSFARDMDQVIASPTQVTFNLDRPSKTLTVLIDGNPVDQIHPEEPAREWTTYTDANHQLHFVDRAALQIQLAHDYSPETELMRPDQNQITLTHIGGHTTLRIKDRDAADGCTQTNIAFDLSNDTSISHSVYIFWHGDTILAQHSKHQTGRGLPTCPFSGDYEFECRECEAPQVKSNTPFMIELLGQLSGLKLDDLNYLYANWGKSRFKEIVEEFKDLPEATTFRASTEEKEHSIHLDDWVTAYQNAFEAVAKNGPKLGEKIVLASLDAIFKNPILLERMGRKLEVQFRDQPGILIAIKNARTSNPITGKEMKLESLLLGSELLPGDPFQVNSISFARACGNPTVRLRETKFNHSSLIELVLLEEGFPLWPSQTKLLRDSFFRIIDQMGCGYDLSQSYGISQPSQLGALLGFNFNPRNYSAWKMFSDPSLAGEAIAFQSELALTPDGDFHRFEDDARQGTVFGHSSINYLELAKKITHGNLEHAVNLLGFFGNDNASFNPQMDLVKTHPQNEFANIAPKTIFNVLDARAPAGVQMMLVDSLGTSSVPKSLLAELKKYDDFQKSVIPAQDQSSDGLRAGNYHAITAFWQTLELMRYLKAHHQDLRGAVFAMETLGLGYSIKHLDQSSFIECLHFDSNECQIKVNRLMQTPRMKNESLFNHLEPARIALQAEQTFQMYRYGARLAYQLFTQPEAKK